MDGRGGTSGSGWRLFAGIVLVTAGFMRIFDAIWAFRTTATLPDGVLGDSLTPYAWLYLVVGIVLVVAAYGVLARAQWARWVGIVAGGVLAISAVWWMPFYPVWALTYVGVGFLVVYALTAHGGDREA